MRKLLLATIVMLAPVPLFAQETVPAPQSMPTPAPTASAPLPGSSAATAYKVRNIDEEYAIMRKLGIKVDMQSLIMSEGGHPYDVLNGVDAKTREKRDVWFDIKSFYGKELGF